MEVTGGRVVAPYIPLFGVRYYVPRKAKYSVSVGSSVRIDPAIDVWGMFADGTTVLQRTDTYLLVQTADGTFSVLQQLPTGQIVMVGDAKTQAMATRLLGYQIKRLG